MTGYNRKEFAIRAAYTQRLARHAPENAFETFYAVNLTKAMTGTFDYQHVENPAYNREGGPADFFAARLQVDFSGVTGGVRQETRPSAACRVVAPIS